MISPNAKWIWIDSEPQKNEYAYFEGTYDWRGESALFSIVAETDYVLYVNEKRVAFGQFAGYPTEKYCDDIDLTPHSREGQNHIRVTVRYEGINSATHIDDGAGVIFSLTVGGKDVLWSNGNTKGGYDNRYLQHLDRRITAQLGLTSGMCSGNRTEERTCVLVQKTDNIKPRPVQKTILGEAVEGKRISDEILLYDLGRETAGYLFLHVRTERAGELQVAYGEHIADGCVRQYIGDRDFSLDFSYDAGEHRFEQLFIRVATRYLQVNAPDGVEVLSVGLLPALYPVTEREHTLSGLDGRIYDTSVRTLRLCMNLHYEDCPWREQALYVLDSRNQMLSGYYAFRESDFQRANLVLMSKGARPDGLLELTYPAVDTPAIPFFSLMYPVAVYEYVKHTGDTSIIGEVLPTIKRFMAEFASRVDENGLIAEFELPYWNFYEWTRESDGAEYWSLRARAKEGDGAARSRRYHLLLNCALAYSCEYFAKLCDMAGESLSVDVEDIKRAIVKAFFNEQSGVFFLSPTCPEVSSQLGNAMALLIGLGDERTVDALKNDEQTVPASLSMLPFVYDALLARGGDCKDYILADIRQKYGQMLASGATSFWETDEGESAFGGAGSLCHGWSAIPVYYYHKLGLCE